MPSIHRFASATIAAGMFVCASAGVNPHAQTGPDVLERGYNRFRTGANTGELTLTPGNVRSTANRFHRQFAMKVDGKVEGSPLFASAISIGGSARNVVYVATMHNTVFAFDADSGALLSARWLGNPAIGNDVDTLKGKSTIHAEWGIASTPIIDRSTRTLYVVRWGYESGTNGPTYRLFGLDISNLANDQFPSAVIDHFTAGNHQFDRYRQVQRAGLALATKPGGAKALIVAFAGGEGVGSTSGWVVAFDTAKLASGMPAVSAWCSTPNNGFGDGGGGGIWMAGAAPAVDDNGDIYVVTGNGPYNPQFASDQLGESLVRLTWNPTAGTLTTSDWFTPFRDADRDKFHTDQDLGSGGVIALPDETGAIIGGKDGVVYHVNRADMGHRDFMKLVDAPFVASFDYRPTNGRNSLFDDLNQTTSTDPFTIGHADGGRTPHIHGSGVFFNNRVFVQGENNAVRVFARTSGHFAATPIARGTATASWGTASPGGMPGGMLALSANGTATAILWANEAFGNLPGDPDSNIVPTPNILRAYDVSTTASGTLQAIWDSEAEPNDRVGAATKFAPPLVANGRVYQATYDNQIVVYGLGAPSPTPTRDVRRTVVFVHGLTQFGQDVFVRGGTKGGAPIRIRHRNWLNPHSTQFRWGDAYLDWDGREPSQAPTPGALGGGSPADWTTSLAQAPDRTKFRWTDGFGITNENTFGRDYWMLDVDLDCEQAFPDAQGRRWFEAKAFMTPTVGWEGDIAQTSNPMPPYTSANHMGICGMVNVFVGNFANRPAGLDPNAAQFVTPSYTYLSPLDERGATADMLTGTPCAVPDEERRCLGNLAQVCKAVAGVDRFRTDQDCNASSIGGNFVQMCQQSTGRCCTPTRQNNNCQ
jgi:hypothetical protein